MVDVMPYRKQENVSGIAGGITWYNRTINTVRSWKKVVHLLSRLGWISTLMSAKVQMMIPVMIRISRLMTITDSQKGIIFRMVSFLPI